MHRSFVTTGLASIALAALLPSTVLAATTALYTTGGGLELAIPDNDAAGVSSTITAIAGDTFLDSVPAAGGIVSAVEVVLSIDHTWVGDLIFTLTSPAGTEITLLDRPGSDGDNDVGDDADLSRREFIYFSDRSLVPAEAMGAGCFRSDDVVGRDCIGAFMPEDNTMAAFAGEQLLGDWTLTLSDNAAGDVGALNGWYIEIDFTPIPLPAPVWLLVSAIACLGLIRRDRGGA